MRYKVFLLFVFLCYVLTPFVSLDAQSIWTSAEIEKKMMKNVTVFAEGEYRSNDGMSATDRWTGTLGANYGVCRYLKMATGYTYIHQRKPAEFTRKGNRIPPFWQPKHRAFFALTGNYVWNRFKFSLRERYQYVYRKGQYVPKFDEDGVIPKNDEWIKEKHKHVLRSRLQIEYGIRNSRFTPFASCEIYNIFSSGFDVEKARWTVGSSYRFNKKHSLELFYRYVDEHDQDEEGDGGHVIGIGYKFKL